MPGGRREFITQVNQISDALLIALVFWMAHSAREQLAFLFPFRYQVYHATFEFGVIAPFRYYKWLYLIILPFYPFLLDINGFYSRAHGLRRRNTFWILLKSCAICVLAVMAAMYFFRLSMLSRAVVMIFAAFSVVALFVKDRLFQAHMHRRARKGKDVTEIILVGSPDRNAHFVEQLELHPEWSLRIAAQLNPNGDLLQELPVLLHRLPVGCVVFNVTQTAFSEIEKASASGAPCARRPVPRTRSSWRRRRTRMRIGTRRANATPRPTRST